MIENTNVENNLTVISPKITEVIDKISGAILSVQEVIGSNYEKVIKLRSELHTLIKREDPRYICPLCHVPVHLVSLPKTRRFFFKHIIEDGNCPSRTRGKMSEAEINACKYNGAKESEAHKQMKEIVAESLKLDGRFKDIAIEQVWKGKKPGEWRKPDISAIFDNEIQVAFEIQLSTTFLRVIIERKEFYLREGGFLFWIFKEIEEENPRLMQDDIFYNNNCNLFLVSKETHHVSCEQKKIFLKCYWIEPTIKDQQIINTSWKSKIISFDQLTFDREQQRVFFFDYDRAKQQLIQQLARDKVEHLWLSNHSSLDSDKLRDLLEKYYVLPPQYDKGELKTLLNALYSVKHGRPIGFKYKQLIEVAHLIENSSKKYLRVFGWALGIYGRKEQIAKEDSSGKWRNKIEKIKPLMKSNDRIYQHDDNFDKLISFLFPELAEKLKK